MKFGWSDAVMFVFHVVEDSCVKGSVMDFVGVMVKLPDGRPMIGREMPPCDQSHLRLAST